MIGTRVHNSQFSQAATRGHPQAEEVRTFARALYAQSFGKRVGGGLDRRLDWVNRRHCGVPGLLHAAAAAIGNLFHLQSTSYP
ncbi:hypothetical protein GPALN_007761 [Globodera pallida]|nr:hypothetical protein GPALN_007761 [Globodera pallida]